MCKCIICESSNIEVKNAVITDFLLERIWDNKKDKNISLIHCNECGFANFSERLNDAESSKLYTGYRSEEYQKQRQKHESWYTKEINSFTTDELEYIARSKNMESIFKSNNVNTDNIKSALDYGGDTGKYIPKILHNAKKFVYDISGVKPEDGVSGITNTDDLNKIKYDFVMSCHLLEHVSSPKEVVGILKSLLSQEGIIYIEVPYDSPFHKHTVNYLNILFNKNYSLKAIIERGILTIKHPYRMSEHINFFTPTSLKKLVTEAGFEIIEVKTFSLKTEHFGICENISLLAKIKQ
jgi:predicted nucleic-acid-binding Zn-ribbon protein